MENIKKLFEESNIDLTEENLAIYLYFINRTKKDSNDFNEPLGNEYIYRPGADKELNNKGEDR